jgi:FtsP/CotA-like multicopper oxidase with cupredoxin domain
VHNVGVSASLNFRIQGHSLLLVETEGSYTSQQNYTNMDIHVGQSYSFLVTMDQNASTDYYVVASVRFVDPSTIDKLTGVAILHYSNSQGPASGPLPDAPDDQYDAAFSINQARSIRHAFLPLCLLAHFWFVFIWLDDDAHSYPELFQVECYR